MWLIDFYLAVLNEFVGRRRPYNIDSIIRETFALSVNQRQQLKDAMKGEFWLHLFIHLFLRCKFFNENSTRIMFVRMIMLIHGGSVCVIL